MRPTIEWQELKWLALERGIRALTPADPAQAPDQDLRCIGRYMGILAHSRGSMVVGEDGTVRVLDYPVRQAWIGVDAAWS